MTTTAPATINVPPVTGFVSTSMNPGTRKIAAIRSPAINATTVYRPRIMAILKPRHQ